MTELLLDVRDVVVEYPAKGFRKQPVPGPQGRIAGHPARARPSAWSASPAPARPRSAGPCSAWRRSPAADPLQRPGHLERQPDAALGPASEIQVVFQDPYTSLNPSLTIEQILTEPLTARKVPSARTPTARVPGCSSRSGCPRTRRDRLPREFSGGQRQRIAIARALALDPQLIVCDEPVSALDLSTQARVLELFKEIQERTGVAYLFVSHDLAVVRHLTHRVAVMHHGEIVEWGDGDQVTARPEHPYTQRLFLAAPVPDPDRQERRADRLRLLHRQREQDLQAGAGG